MAARPRQKGSYDLPSNLYYEKSRKRYRYRRPDTGSWHSMGADRNKAIAAARKLNDHFAVPSDDLFEKVVANKITFGAYVAIYKREELPPRKLAQDTIDLYNIRFKQAMDAWAEMAIDSITLLMVNALLDSLTTRASNQMRSLLIDFFGYAQSKGIIPDNPAAATRPKIETVSRRRHTVEGLTLIRNHADPWLQNAIDLALLTAQRRHDLVNLKWSQIKDGYIHIAQNKTTDADSDDLDDLQGAGFVRIKINPAIGALLERCNDGILSPYVLHRKPKRLDRKQMAHKQHPTQIEGRYLTRAFKAARDKANPYPTYAPEEQPAFHDIRALSLYLITVAQRDAQSTAGHSNPKMTQHYVDGHGVIWTNVDGWDNLPWHTNL